MCLVTLYNMCLECTNITWLHKIFVSSKSPQASVLFPSEAWDSSQEIWPLISFCLLSLYKSLVKLFYHCELQLHNI